MVQHHVEHPRGGLWRRRRASIRAAYGQGYAGPPCFTTLPSSQTSLPPVLPPPNHHLLPILVALTATFSSLSPAFHPCVSLFSPSPDQSSPPVIFMSWWVMLQSEFSCHLSSHDCWPSEQSRKPLRMQQSNICLHLPCIRHILSTVQISSW